MSHFEQSLRSGDFNIEQKDDGTNQLSGLDQLTRDVKSVFGRIQTKQGLIQNKRQELNARFCQKILSVKQDKNKRKFKQQMMHEQLRVLQRHQNSKALLRGGIIDEDFLRKQRQLEDGHEKKLKRMFNPGSDFAQEQENTDARFKSDSIDQIVEDIIDYTKMGLFQITEDVEEPRVIVDEYDNIKSKQFEIKDRSTISDTQNTVQASSNRGFQSVRFGFQNNARPRTQERNRGIVAVKSSKSKQRTASSAAPKEDCSHHHGHSADQLLSVNDITSFEDSREEQDLVDELLARITGAPDIKVLNMYMGDVAPSLLKEVATRVMDPDYLDGLSPFEFQKILACNKVREELTYKMALHQSQKEILQQQVGLRVTGHKKRQAIVSDAKASSSDKGGCGKARACQHTVEKWIKFILQNCGRDNFIKYLKGKITLDQFMTRISESASGIRYKVLDDIRMEPILMVNNKEVHQMVREIDKDPHAGALHENLHLFKIGKKCFRSINWQKDRVRGKSEEIRRKIEKVQKQKHALNVKRRREAKEAEREKDTCHHIERREKQLKDHYENTERAREKERKFRDSNKCVHDLQKQRITIAIKKYIREKVFTKECFKEVRNMQREAQKSNNPMLKVISDKLIDKYGYSQDLKQDLFHPEDYLKIYEKRAQMKANKRAMSASMDLKDRRNSLNYDSQEEPVLSKKAARDKDLARHYEMKNRLIQRFQSIKFIMRLLALGQKVILDPKDEILLTQGIPSGDSTILAGSGACSNNASPRITLSNDATKTIESKSVPRKMLWQSPSKVQNQQTDYNAEFRSLLKEVIQPEQIFVRGVSLSNMKPQAKEVKAKVDEAVSKKSSIFELNKAYEELVESRQLDEQMCLNIEGLNTIGYSNYVKTFEMQVPDHQQQNSDSHELLLSQQSQAANRYASVNNLVETNMPIKEEANEPETAELMLIQDDLVAKNQVEQIKKPMLIKRKESASHVAEGSSDATVINTIKSTAEPVPPISPGYTDLQYKGTNKILSENHEQQPNRGPTLNEYDTSQSLQNQRITLDQSQDRSTKSIRTNDSITNPKVNGVVHHVVEEDNNIILHTENSQKVLDPTMSLKKGKEPVQTEVLSPNPYEDLLRSTGTQNTKRNLWIRPKTFQIKTHNRSVTQLATSMAAAKQQSIMQLYETPSIDFNANIDAVRSQPQITRPRSDLQQANVLQSYKKQILEDLKRMGGRQAQKLVQKYTTVQKGGGSITIQPADMDDESPLVQNVFTKQYDSKEVLIRQESAQISDSTGRKYNKELVRKMNSRLEDKIMRQSLQINRTLERSQNEKDNQKVTQSPYVNYFESQKDIIKHRQTKSSLSGDVKSKQLRQRMSTSTGAKEREPPKPIESAEQSEIQQQVTQQVLTDLQDDPRRKVLLTLPKPVTLSNSTPGFTPLASAHEFDLKQVSFQKSSVIKMIRCNEKLAGEIKQQIFEQQFSDESSRVDPEVLHHHYPMSSLQVSMKGARVAENKLKLTNLMKKNAELEVLLKELESYERELNSLNVTPPIVELKSQVVPNPIITKDQSDKEQKEKKVPLSSPRNDYRGVEEGFSKSRPQSASQNPLSFSEKEISLMQQLSLVNDTATNVDEAGASIQIFGKNEGTSINIEDTKKFNQAIIQHKLLNDNVVATVGDAKTGTDNQETHNTINNQTQETTGYLTAANREKTAKKGRDFVKRNMNNTKTDRILNKRNPDVFKERQHPTKTVNLNEQIEDLSNTFGESLKFATIGAAHKDKKVQEILKDKHRYEDNDFIYHAYQIPKRVDPAQSLTTLPTENPWNQQTIDKDNQSQSIVMTTQGDMYKHSESPRQQLVIESRPRNTVDSIQTLTLKRQKSSVFDAKVPDTNPSVESRGDFIPAKANIQRQNSASLYKRKVRAQRAVTQDFDKIEKSTVTGHKSPYQPKAIADADKIVKELEKARKTISSSDSRRSSSKKVVYSQRSLSPHPEVQQSAKMDNFSIRIEKKSENTKSDSMVGRHVSTHAHNRILKMIKDCKEAKVETCPDTMTNTLKKGNAKSSMAATTTVTAEDPEFSYRRQQQIRLSQLIERKRSGQNHSIKELVKSKSRLLQTTMLLEHNYDQLEEIVVGEDQPVVDMENLVTKSDKSQPNLMSNQSFQLESEQGQTKLQAALSSYPELSPDNTVSVEVFEAFPQLRLSHSKLKEGQSSNSPVKVAEKHIKNNQSLKATLEHRTLERSGSQAKIVFQVVTNTTNSPRKLTQER